MVESLWPDAEALARLRDGAPWHPAALLEFSESCADVRIRLFAHAFGPVLTQGVRREHVAVRGDLYAVEVATAQAGAILFIENRNDVPVEGSVIPVLPEISVPVRSIFAYVHDFPIGATNRYLQAYVGLVKSDGFVISAEIRPDPYAGARVYLCGEISNPGYEVVLFHGHDRGKALSVRVGAEPVVYTLGESQIVALSFAHAASLDMQQVLSGGDVAIQDHTSSQTYVITPSGEIQLVPNA